MTAVVTGASGFVGGAIVRRLLADGESVVALVRSRVAASKVSSLGADPVIVDLADTDASARAMRGAETVFHVAGRNAMCPVGPRSCTGTTSIWRSRTTATRASGCWSTS